MKAIEATDLRKTYGPVTALDGVDFAARPGGVHCLAGPNGSGKSTLLRLVAGLCRPTGGRLSVPDVPLGYAFQRPNAYPDLTVEQNLAVFARLVDARDDWRETLIERLRLAPARHRRTGDLSDGFGKKLDLALALLKEPTILLLDEPLADIDDVTAGRLLALLAAYRSPERIVLASTHNVERFDDAGVVDRLTVVRDGRVRLSADPAALPSKPQDAYLDALGVER